MVLRLNEVTNRSADLFETDNNQSVAIGRIGNGFASLESKIEALETKEACSHDNKFLRIIMLEERVCEELKREPRNKFRKIVDQIGGNFRNEALVDVTVSSVKRRFGVKHGPFSMLVARFNDSITASNLLQSFIKANRMKKTNYFAEVPMSKKVYKIKRICMQLKSEGYIESVKGADRGVIVTYYHAEQGNEGRKFKTIASLEDIDDLRRELRTKNFETPCSDLYSDNFWQNKQPKELKQNQELDSSLASLDVLEYGNIEEALNMFLESSKHRDPSALVQEVNQFRERLKSRNSP